MPAPESNRNDEFIRLFTAHEAHLRAFVRALVPSVADANDVMQEAAVQLWHKFGEFRPGTDFRAWAFSVVRFKVLSWHRDLARERCVLGTEAIELLAADAAARADGLEDRREALRHCLQKLPEADRRLVDAVYESDTAINDVAREAGRTAMALYKQLHRVRLALAQCVRGSLAREGLQ
jgi:RNA polymerase sigma-70 factor (ECF subfamily)